ncbi:uncharacterized protein ARMOST_21395 [Armillaria ostoyae]|uniref:Uncharacterized protein n=1 Tax=Armillaria ostoyae TaxID=47428 RepID=A0A284S9Z6_ARMOS|nr:uncharacterized protein ARMOST_21395 [Armillaria ostoyae]
MSDHEALALATSGKHVILFIRTSNAISSILDERLRRETQVHEPETVVSQEDAQLLLPNRVLEEVERGVFVHVSYKHGTVTVGIPITLSWHRDVNDTGQIEFTILPYSDLPLGPESGFSASATDTVHPVGTVNVTFPRPAGEYAIEGVDRSGVVSTSQIFDVTDNNNTSASSSEVVLSLTAVQSGSTRDSEPYSTSAKSVQSTATTPPSSSSIHRNHKTPIIIGAVIGSLVSLLLVFGGGAFLFIRKRRRRNRNSTTNLKITQELNSHSPPVGNKNGETITPMLAGGVVPDLDDRSQEIVEQNPEGNPTEDEGERRNNISSPVHVDISEPQVPPQQEGPRASLGDVVAEVVRLRTQFRQFVVEREAERVHGNELDPPPAYA